MESAVRSALQGRGGTIFGVVEEMKTVQRPVGKLCTKLYTITGGGCMVFLCSICKKVHLIFEEQFDFEGMFWILMTESKLKN